MSGIEVGGSKVEIVDPNKKVVEDYLKSNEYIISLKKWKTHTWQILVNSTITITVNEWWPIYYKYKTSSWIINNNNSSTITEDSNSTWSFYIENLWGYSKIKISSNKIWNFLSKYRKYSIYKNIWNKKKIKTTWEIKNF